MQSVPVHRSILAGDIEKSTSALRTNPIKEELRQEAYGMLEAPIRAGIRRRRHPRRTLRPVCRSRRPSPGPIHLIHPVDDVPKTLLLNPLVPALWQFLVDRDRGLPGTARRAPPDPPRGR